MDFVHKINLMEKKPAIESDLSGILDQFLKKLNDAETLLENGIFATNFSEAALFLQSSAELYGKKVDLLWDCILDYQKRIVLYDDNPNKKQGNLELEKIEERRNKHKRKGKEKKKCEVLREENIIYSRAFGPHPCLRKKDEAPQQTDDSDSELVDSWMAFESRGKPEYSTTIELDKGRLEDDSELFCDFDIYDSEGEFVTKYSRVLGNKVILKLFEFNNWGFLKNENEIISKLRIDTYLLDQFIREKKIGYLTPREQYEAEFQIYAKKKLEEEEQEWIEKRRKESTQPEQFATPPVRRESVREPIKADDRSQTPSICSKLVVNINKLPLEVVKRKLTNDSGFYDEVDNSSDEGDMACECEDDSSDEPIKTVDSISTLPTNEDINKSDTNEADIIHNKSDHDDSAICATDIGEETENTSDNAIITNDTGDDTCDIQSNNPIFNNTTCDTNILKDSTNLQKSIKDQPCFGGSQVILKPQTPKTRELKEKVPKTLESSQKNNLKRPTEDYETPTKRRKLSQKQIEKLSQPLATVKASTWEKFYCLNYEPDFGEGDIPDVDTDSADENDPPDDDPFDPCTDDFSAANDVHETTLNTMCSSSHQNTESQIQETCTTVPSTSEEDISITVPSTSDQNNTSAPCISTIDGVAFESSIPSTSDESDDPNISSYLAAVNAAALQESMNEEVRKNVSKWKSYITPILAKLDGSEFDIHEYGSKIIDSMEDNESKKFSDIVSCKKSSEVVRYFISSLQLANTYNVQIDGVKQGERANNSFRLKLLSRERYHEHLQEYEAPSEETFRKRLAQVQATNPHIQLQSTPRAISKKGGSKRFRAS